MKIMPYYKVAECPFDGYVWRVKGQMAPKSCPQCKRRFESPWAPDKKVKIEKKEFRSYGELLKFLEEKNR